MDRIEAYSILNSELNVFANYSINELTKMVGESIESDFTTEKGTSYSLSFAVQKNEKGIISVQGSIHDKNSFKFELLEESLTLNS